MRAKWLIGLVLALLLTGCTGGESGKDDGTVTLRFQSLAWQEESVTANQQLVKEWNATHPDVKVEYVQGVGTASTTSSSPPSRAARRPTSSTTPPTTSRTSPMAAISPT